MDGLVVDIVVGLSWMDWIECVFGVIYEYVEVVWVVVSCVCVCLWCLCVEEDWGNEEEDGDLCGSCVI